MMDHSYNIDLFGFNIFNVEYMQESIKIIINNMLELKNLKQNI